MSMSLDYQSQGETTVWIGKLILFFGIGFNFYLGWTLGFGALAVATAAIVLLFDLAKMTLTKGAVIKYKQGDFPVFTGLWIIILTLLSMAAGTMFYSYNMHNVSKFVHENSTDVKTAQQTLELSQASQKQFAGFNSLEATDQIAELEKQMAAILASPVVNKNGSPAGNIGGRTENCLGSGSYYASAYAKECQQYNQLAAEADALKRKIGMATSANSTALNSATAALETLGDFSIAEGIPGFAVLGRMFYPHLPEKEAAKQVYAKANVVVAVITELLGTCMLIIGYSMMGLTGRNPAPLQPTGTDRNR